MYNLAEFLEMRYGRGVTALYSPVAGALCILFIGGFLLAIAKILAALTTLSTTECVIVISMLVGAYVFSGGMMSALLTGVLQVLMCLLILNFILLPFLWIEVNGFAALRALPKEIWNFTDPELMTVSTVLALNLSARFGHQGIPVNARSAMDPDEHITPGRRESIRFSHIPHLRQENRELFRNRSTGNRELPSQDPAPGGKQRELIAESVPGLSKQVPDLRKHFLRVSGS